MATDGMAGTPQPVQSVGGDGRDGGGGGESGDEEGNMDEQRRRSNPIVDLDSEWGSEWGSGSEWETMSEDGEGEYVEGGEEGEEGGTEGGVEGGYGSIPAQEALSPNAASLFTRYM